MRKLVTSELGLRLNERLAKLAMSRLEYGYVDELMVSFSVRSKTGIFIPVTEEKFAASKDQGEIGIFGTLDPTEAVRLLVQRYPKATLLMRKDPVKR